MLQALSILPVNSECFERKLIHTFIDDTHCSVIWAVAWKYSDSFIFSRGARNICPVIFRFLLNLQNSVNTPLSFFLYLELHC